MMIDQAQEHLQKVQAAMSKLNTLLTMMKITADYLGEHRDELERVELIDITELLIDQLEDISPNLDSVDMFLNGLFCESKRQGA